MLTCWIVGGRLLLLARRTRRAPELLIGLGLFLVGGWWSPLVAVGRQATALSDSSRGAVVASGALCAVAVCLAVMACFAAQTAGVGWAGFARDERGPWLLATWVAVANYLWANVEAWRHYAMLARRRRLGLADAVVADRVRLWAMALLASILASGTAAVFQSLAIQMGGTSVGLWLAAIAALIAATCLWLAFLPPARYLAWVRLRAAAEA